MIALVKEKATSGLWMREVPVPTVGKNDVKIKIKKTAICGTDLHIYNWDEWSQNTIKTPMTIGHEYVGEIVEIGENVDMFHIGERVTGEGHVVCGHCRNCLAGRGHLCREAKGVGVNRDGAFAEYLVVPAKNVLKCVDSISDDLYSIFDPFGNATHTALSYDLVGEDVLITGAGSIGIMAAAIAKFCGARNTVITDINDFRLELAKKFGVTTVNTMKEDLGAVMSSLNIREGFDIGLEMSGSAVAFNQMIDNMVNGGKIAMLGIPKNDMKINWETVVFRCLNIRGIYGRQMFETWYKMSAMIEGGLDISPIITHHFDVRDFEKGFEAMNSGKSGKVILDWTKLHA
ncbi:MAG: L-threonine 3-dehydrogenase [Clostridiales bacterium]|nr:L-threonine 3-dehydrogenase [Clostridiales bacterium]